MKYLLILFCIAGCINKTVYENEIVDEPIEKLISINFKTRSEEKQLNELIRVNAFVPLQFEKSNPISEITKAYFYNNEYYILDSTLGTIGVYDATGEFVRSYGKIGVGPAEYTDIMDFCLDIENKEIFILSLDLRKVLIFSLEGKFVKYFKIPFQANRIALVDSEKIAFSLTYYDETNENLKVTDRSGKVLYSDFPFPKETFPINLRNITGNLISSRQGILYNDATSSSFYFIDRNLIKSKKYELDFGSDSWPKDQTYDFKGFFEKVAQGQLSYVTPQFQALDNENFMFRMNKRVNESSKRIVDFRFALYSSQLNKVFYSKGSEIDLKFIAPIGRSLQDSNLIGQINIADLNSVSDLFEYFNYSHDYQLDDIRDQAILVIFETNPSLF
jgi:hypothetical protein